VWPHRLSCAVRRLWLRRVWGAVRRVVMAAWKEKEAVGGELSSVLIHHTHRLLSTHVFGRKRA